MANGIWRRERAGRKEIWVVYKDESGKKHRVKVGLDTPQMLVTAKEILAKRQHEAVTFKHFPERKERRVIVETMFREAAQEYWNLVLYKADKSWHWRWNKLVEEFGDTRLVDFESKRIQGWYNDEVSRSKTGAGSANRSLSLLGSIFKAAIKWKLYVLANPVNDVKTQADPEPRTRFLSKDEMLIFFAKNDPRLLPVVLFALLVGLRKTESLWFKWEDVASDLSSIKAHRQKKGAFPHIPVTDKLRQLLLSLGPRKEGRLFDLCPMTFRRLFEKARKDALAAGVAHFTWHDLRRTFGSHFTMLTKDRASLRKLLGHRTNYMVDRYAYLDDDHLRTQMEAFDAGMPELPATLRCLDSLGVGHHVGHQPERQLVEAEALNKEIAIMPQ